MRNNLPAIYPGEVLRDELDELGVSANAFARALAVPANRITAILQGRRGITADTALRLARYFGTAPELWLNLQRSYDLKLARQKSGAEIERLVKPRAA